jgi:metabolite-proton symporter
VTDSAEADRAATIRRVVLASFIGTTIEWYDFFLYGTAAALVFNKLFFPTSDPSTGTMAAFGTFAIGFFARPLGGVICGHYGDRVGRKSMLVITLVVMGMATFLIGAMPTYASIGVWAPILLTALRFVQGLGVGGEWGGAVLMAVEHGGREKRGLYASWPQAGVPAGLFLSTAVFFFFARLPEAELLSWGWRIPFLLGILLVGVGLFIRLKVLESPLFAKVQTEKSVSKMPILEAIRTYPRNILLTMGARLAENVSFYIFSVFVLSYASERLGVPRSTVLLGLLIAAGVEFLTIPAFGALSDRVGRRPVYMVGAVLSGLFAFPFFWLVETRQATWIWTAIAVALGVGHAAMYAPQAAFFSELFGTRVRYSGASLGYQLASPLAGGLAPLIAAALIDASGGRSWPVALYVAAMAGLTLLSVWFAEETSKSDLS